jgi:hypothetical protein
MPGTATETLWSKQQKQTQIQIAVFSSWLWSFINVYVNIILIVAKISQKHRNANT